MRKKQRYLQSPSHTSAFSVAMLQAVGAWSSARKLRCTYTPTDKTKASEQYTGSISRFGTDIGYVQSGVILWSVYAPETEAATNPGFLGGRYQGQTASATLGPGVGLKNAMVGGPG